MVIVTQFAGQAQFAGLVLSARQVIGAQTLGAVGSGGRKAHCSNGWPGIEVGHIAKPEGLQNPLAQSLSVVQLVPQALAPVPPPPLPVVGVICGKPLGLFDGCGISEGLGDIDGHGFATAPAALIFFTASLGSISLPVGSTPSDG